MLYMGLCKVVFKMVYCTLTLRIIRSVYINHFETTTNPDYMRGPPSPSRDRDGIGRREVSGISYDHYIISQLNSICSCLISQVWARGIIKKKIHIPWTLTLP